MLSSNELIDTIGTYEAQNALPHFDHDQDHELSSDPPPATQVTPQQGPTQQQIEANNLSRCFELTPLFGSAEQALVLSHALEADELDSDSATESAVVSTAVANASGIITAIITHYCLRSSYRTGKYQITLRAEAPSANDQAQMKKNDIIIFLENGFLCYFVKRSSGRPIQGQIPLDDNDAEGITGYAELCALKNSLANLSADEENPRISPEQQRAFLKYTAKLGHTYSGKTSTNPLYRAVKTLSAFGVRLAAVLSILIGSDNPSKRRIISFILSDIFCIVFGLFGVGYFLVRDKILKIPPNTRHKYDLTGTEGWTKYSKTALTFGTAVGQGVGGLIVGIAHAASNAAATVSSFSIAFWGGIVGVISFVLSIIAVPLINWISSKFTRDGKGILVSNHKNKFRNNYTRSGITLGSGLGAILGLMLGHWFFGVIMAATVFSALGAVIGGIAISVYGNQIHRKLHPLPPGKTEKDEDIENSWDYVSRSTASVFGYIGAAVVCAINPAAALLLIPIGTGIASAIGWGVGILIMRKARRLPGNEEEKKSTTLPWTQRITTGANVGSIIGSCVGLGFGFAGLFLAGPAGVIFAVSLFGAIGAIVGGTVGALYDKEARKLVWQAINPFKSDPVVQTRDLSSSAKVLMQEPIKNVDLQENKLNQQVDTQENELIEHNVVPITPHELSSDSVSPPLSITLPSPVSRGILSNNRSSHFHSLQEQKQGQAVDRNALTRTDSYSRSPSLSPVSAF